MKFTIKTQCFVTRYYEVQAKTKEEADKPNTSIEDSLNDTNEASIVIVEESGSSFYASAEESVSDNKEEKTFNFLTHILIWK